MTYRQGRDPRDVARELYADAQQAMVACEIAHQNAIADHAIAKFELEHARTVLGHQIEIEREQNALRAASGAAPSEDEGQPVTLARAKLVAAEQRLESARLSVEARFDDKAEAAKRLRDAQAELERDR